MGAPSKPETDDAHPSAAHMGRGFFVSQSPTEESTLNRRETFSFTATLVPHAGTASLLRIVSILHSRGVEIHHLSHSADSPCGVTVAGCVTSGNAGREALEGCLRRAVEVAEVSTCVEGPLGLMGTQA